MGHETMFDRMFKAWEQQTADYFEKMFRDPGVLKTSGSLMSSALRSKIFVDDLLLATWKSLLLPNKRDQERTLHLLNETQSRINDLEERLEDQELAAQGRAQVLEAGQHQQIAALSRKVDQLADMVSALIADKTPPKPSKIKHKAN